MQFRNYLCLSKRINLLEIFSWMSFFCSSILGSFDYFYSLNLGGFSFIKKLKNKTTNEKTM